jgi:hypothetical protein
VAQPQWLAARQAWLAARQAQPDGQAEYLGDTVALHQAPGGGWHAQPVAARALTKKAVGAGRDGFSLARACSVAQGQAAVAARVIGAVEAVLAHRLAAQRGRADQHGGQVVGRLRRPELVAIGLQQLRVSGEMAKFSMLVTSGSHCWWKRGASTASTFMP